QAPAASTIPAGRTSCCAMPADQSRRPGGSGAPCSVAQFARECHDQHAVQSSLRSLVWRSKGAAGRRNGPINRPRAPRRRSGYHGDEMATMDPDLVKRVQAIFDRAPFIAELGITVEEIGPGRCSTALAVAPRHTQQSGFVRAGVIATLADHTAGACAGTLAAPRPPVLTPTLTLPLLPPARGERLVCRATALRPGRTVSIVESEVFVDGAGGETLVAKATVTLALVRDAAG